MTTERATIMTRMKMVSLSRRALCAAALCTFTAPAAHPQAGSYAAMSPVTEYMIANRSDEVGLARSAAPPSIADHAEVLVLGAKGYETAVKGTNGFVCFVGRSWDMAYTSPEFWNPKIRTPQCANATSARSVLPRYLMRTKRVLAHASKPEMQKLETADRTAGILTAPELGSVCYMMSKRGYINDDAHGAWHPHVMFFAPRTASASWGADLAGSPMAADSTSYEATTIFFVVVPNWSDGTAGSALRM